MKKILKKFKSWCNTKRIPYSRISGPLPFAYQRLVFGEGSGRYFFGPKVSFGWKDAAGFKEGASFINARDDAYVRIENGVVFNNNANICAELRGGVTIGKGCCIGADFVCVNSNFHGLKAVDRHNRNAISVADVNIGDDCFIGNRVMILKGVTLGSGCVVGAGSVVTSSFPSNSIIAGNPAKLIREITQNPNN